jgi:hypothetical protein
MAAAAKQREIRAQESVPAFVVGEAAWLFGPQATFNRKAEVRTKPQMRIVEGRVVHRLERLADAAPPTATLSWCLSAGSRARRRVSVASRVRRKEERNKDPRQI